MNKNKLKSRVDPVEVYCRQRPLSNNENESCLKILDENNLMLQVPECSASYRTGQIKQLIYSFTQIFDETTSQKQIFEQTALPLVQDLIDGKNGLLFTYGVTGSGKTYTMIGNQKETGLLQRSLDILFNSIADQQANKYVFKPDKLNSFEMQTEVESSIDRYQQKNFPIPKSSSSHQLNSKTQKLIKMSDLNGKILKTTENYIYAVFISCIEIYNNYIYDLLDEFGASSSDGPRKMDLNAKESKNLKEDAKGSMYIKDVNEIEVKSAEEALELMNRAQKRRVVAYTDLNSESSRSHSIITIRLVQTCSNSGTKDIQLNQKLKSNIIVSQLSLVDLAGSERTKRTKNTGCRLKEAGSINSSLMALRNCMETLRENLTNGTTNKKMVPYRDSKLTLLFKNFFEGFGRIKMILCINPNAIEFDETINVLKFSELVRDVLVPTAVAPERITSTEKILNDTFYTDELSLLKKLQENNYSFMKNSFPPIDIFSPEDDKTINNLILYLEEYQRNRDRIINETEQLKQQFMAYLRNVDEQEEKIKEERDDYKNRLEQKEKEQIKSESKIKTLEKIINTNSFNTPITNGKSQTDSYNSESDNQSKPKTNGSTGGSSTASASATKAKISYLQGETPTTSSSVQRSSRLNYPSSSQPIGRTVPSTGGTLNALPPRITMQTATTATSSRNRFLSPSIASKQSVYQIQQQFQNQNQQNNVKEGVPVANKRNQRRSKSAEMWLDHKPASTAKLETVMQPKMKRKKSVNKIEFNDTQKSSKYVLTHQQQDEEGEIVTNLIKGDILVSPSGGSNIIFTDVEILKIKGHETISKPAHRRPQTNEINSIENRALIEDRCSIAIEGNRKTNRFK